MKFENITKARQVNGDDQNFCKPAFLRAAAVCNNGDIDSLHELKAYLRSEQEECQRRAVWETSMQKYYHPNAALSYDMEAKAFGIMLEILDEVGVK